MAESGTRGGGMARDRLVGAGRLVRSLDVRCDLRPEGVGLAAREATDAGWRVLP